MKLTSDSHPALYQKLTVPMVHEKSKHLLAEVYRGRLDGDLGDNAAFSDVYTMKRMSKENPGKAAAAPAPFEFVAEDNMDFENFKNRPEFSDEHGGEGSVYGASINRPETPGSAFGDHRGRSASRESARTLNDEQPGMTYPAGYHQTPSNLREYSPSPAAQYRIPDTSSPYEIPAQTNLLAGAAPMGRDPPTAYTPYSPDRDGQQHDYFRR
jgi:hypothetical protein